MLTTDQKEAILQRAGVALPASWEGSSDAQLQQANGGRTVKQCLQADSKALGEEQRTRTINALFDAYTARRAAQSLRDADASRQAGAPARGRGGSMP